MGELLKNKKLVGMVVGLLLAGLGSLVGWNVKDEVCPVAEKAPAVEAPAAVAAPAK